jgi:predicted transcriptional regulator
LKPPCTVVVQHILPSLRLEIAKKLIMEHGLKKTRVAQKMSVTPAAVTQYLKGSRGDSASTMIERSERVMSLVSDISGDIARGESPLDVLLLKMCRVCSAVRAEGLICDLHKEAMPGLRSIDSCACSLGLVSSEN